MAERESSQCERAGKNCVELVRALIFRIKQTHSQLQGAELEDGEDKKVQEEVTKLRSKQKGRKK